MTISDIDRALTFSQGIAAKDADLATRYMSPDRLVQHDPRMADGRAGLREYVEQLPDDGHPLDVVRTFQDGTFVVTQHQGSIRGRTVFFDVFRLEDGLIVEHWGFSSEGGPPNRSGRTQADGPTEPRHLEDTAANKSLVREYYETVHLAGHYDRIPRYFSGDLCLRYEPGVADGVTAFMQDLKVLTQSRSIDELRLLLGQGDFVFLVASGSAGGEPCVYVDLYRVADGKLTAHWGFPEDVSPVEQRRNTHDVV